MSQKSVTVSYIECDFCHEKIGENQHRVCIAGVNDDPAYLAVETKNTHLFALVQDGQHFHTACFIQHIKKELEES